MLLVHAASCSRVVVDVPQFQVWLQYLCLGKGQPCSHAVQSHVAACLKHPFFMAHSQGMES